MKRLFAVTTLASLAMVFAGHAAQAGDGSTIVADIWAWIDGFFVDLGPGRSWPGGGGVHAAPAPLLAAGIPAFVAVGGIVAFGKLRRKFSRRS